MVTRDIIFWLFYISILYEIYQYFKVKQEYRLFNYKQIVMKIIDKMYIKKIIKEINKEIIEELIENDISSTV